jgi:hypothetical protein
MKLPLPGVETPGYCRARYGALPFWFSGLCSDYGGDPGPFPFNNVFAAPMFSYLS